MTNTGEIKSHPYEKTTPHVPWPCGELRMLITGDAVEMPSKLVPQHEHRSSSRECFPVKRLAVEDPIASGMKIHSA